MADEGKQDKTKKVSSAEEANLEKKPMCGIIMPISALDECSAEHWVDVRDIIMQAIDLAGFEGRMVNDADDVGVIHKRIIQNIYQDPIVVCDVSGKNSNVMFELGLRLAFDKPTIIVKDDKTGYSFDTSAIEHIEYPRDLRFTKIVEFKDRLASKIKHTYSASVSGEHFTTFLKHFGEFKIPKFNEKEVSSDEYILEELRTLRMEVRKISRQNDRYRYPDKIDIEYKSMMRSSDSICMGKMTSENLDNIISKAINIMPNIEFEKEKRGENHYHLKFNPNNPEVRRLILDLIKSS